MRKPHADQGEGFSDRLARRPEDPTRAEPTFQRDDAIRIFLPGRTVTEYALRRRIDTAAIMAAKAAPRTPHDCARVIFWAATDLANEWRLRAGSEDHLRDVIHALAMMLAAARAVERTEAVDG